MERAKLVVEPSGVVAVAAVCGSAFRERPEIQRVGIVLTGGNVDLAKLPEFLALESE
jgi:threonine dehydratase